jgi:parvulin-like peptidyl-prolyl isomerase
MAENKNSTNEDKPDSDATERERPAKDDQPSKADPSERAPDDDDDDDEAKTPAKAPDKKAAKKVDDDEDDDDEDDDDEDDDDEDDDDDDDEEEDDEDEAKKPAKGPDKKAAKKVDDDEDDDDEDDDDEDDDDEEEDDDDDEEEDDKARRKAPPVVGRKPERDAPSEAESDDWLPDWAPWAVLVLLLTVGALGGLGVFNSRPESGLSAADVVASVVPSPEPAPAPSAANPDQETIEASHLLVMHKDSMRAAPGVTRTKEEAKKRAEEALGKIRGGANFDQIVSDYTDEPGGKDRKGSLGRFARRAMVKPFSDAAFALRPGQISGVVETSFGYHIIRRTQ